MFVLQNILEKLNIEIPRNNPSKDVLKFLDAIALPEDVVMELVSISSDSEVNIGPFQFFEFNRLKEINTSEPYIPWLRSGHLSFAAGLNGDPVTFDLRQHRVAFISHDKMDSANSVDVSAVVSSNLRFQDFFSSASEDGSFPCDSYAAKERWPQEPWKTF